MHKWGIGRLCSSPITQTVPSILEQRFVRRSSKFRWRAAHLTPADIPGIHKGRLLRLRS